MIEFRYNNKLDLHHVLNDGEDVGYISKFRGDKQYHLRMEINVTQDQLEQILNKMKELQGDKSRLDYLQADLAEVTKLYESAVASNDPFGKTQLRQRITSIKTEIEELQGENNAKSS